MTRLVLVCLLLAGLLVQLAASAERSPQFEPLRKSKGRRPKQKDATSTTTTTSFGHFNPHHAKPSLGYTEASAGRLDSISLSGLGGLQATQFPPLGQGTTAVAQSPAQRSSEFVKGKSKRELRKSRGNICPALFAQIEVCSAIEATLFADPRCGQRGYLGSLAGQPHTQNGRAMEVEMESSSVARPYQKVN